MTTTTPTPTDLADRLAEVVPRELRGLQQRAATFEGIDSEDERVIVLRAVPYDIETRLGEHLYESFEPGAFARAAKDPARVKLWFGHSTAGGQIVGQAAEVDDRGDGSWIRARVSQIQAGDDLLTLAHDGVLDEASVEFAPIRDAMVVERRGAALHVRHRRGHLRGVALVPHGAYGRDATVTMVRDEDDTDRERAREAALTRLRALDG